MIRRIRIPAQFARRTFSDVKPKAYRYRTEKEVWLSDSGAYPVMGTIIFGLFFTTSVTVYSTFANEDARWGASRKSLFRGEMAREYQHPVRED